MASWLIGGLVGFLVAVVLFARASVRLAKHADQVMSDTWRVRHREVR